MKRKWLVAMGWLASFLIWTLAVQYVDVAQVGPNGSAVGLATLNTWFHSLTGVNMTLYTLTDWLGLVPVAVCVVFAVMGIRQWIVRKHLLRVDADLLILGGFYILTMAAYLLFEEVVINYRPVWINGYLEASYPSSTTLLVLCVMLTAWHQVNQRVRNHTARRILWMLIGVFVLGMVVGRLLSGVHWLSDIIGGILLSFGLFALYDAACSCVKR